jgi:hypothetical protein
MNFELCIPALEYLATGLVLDLIRRRLLVIEFRVKMTVLFQMGHTKKIIFKFKMTVLFQVNEIREWKSLAQKFSHESNVSEVKKNALKNSLEIRLEPKLRELEIASSPSSVDKAKDRLRSCLDRKPALASELTRVEVDIEVYILKIICE